MPPIAPGVTDGRSAGSTDPGRDAAELDAILRAEAVTPLFQPIVDLASGRAVAFEALARGPSGSALASPDRLFAAARQAGRVVELDLLCRLRALDAVAESNLEAPFSLFINREPSAVGNGAPSAVQQGSLRRRGLRVVIELTERDLSRDPAGLLAFADAVRAAGLGIALDDVGADADSLALMPFLMPDVVKLDMGLLQRRPDSTTAGVLSAVRAHAERRGAAILAEGIETDEQQRMATAMGATLGQGWRFGRPAPLDDVTVPPPTPSRSLAMRDPEPELAAASPFAMATASRPALRGPVALIDALRAEIERSVAAMHGRAVVLLSCIDAPRISGACARHYTELAAHARLAVALGADMPDEVVPGLRGSRLTPGDPVGTEWDLVVVSPHFAAAVIARERPDPHPDEDRVFDYVLTHDRTLVVDIARSLMTRALPRDDARPAVDALLAEAGLAPAPPA